MEAFIKNNLILILIITAWQLAWTAYGLWLAARARRVWWFIVMLLINSLGILEILYILVFDESEENVFQQHRKSQANQASDENEHTHESD